MSVEQDRGDPCRSRAIHWFREAAARDNAVGQARVAVWEAGCPGGDAVAARGLDERACDGGLGSACAHLAILWRDGVGGPASAETSDRWLARACDAEHPDVDACYLLRATPPATPDAAGGATLAALQRGCASGDAVSCRNVGALLDGGEGQDSERASAAYARACALGDEASCR